MALGNKEIMARNIRKYLRISQKSQKDVCRDLGIKEMTFSDWVNAKTYPRIDKIELLANYFGIEKSDLVEDDTVKRPSIPVYEIKILGKVVAGTPMEAIQDITGTIRITNPDAANGHYYGLRVEGQSMEPEMHEGDLLIIHEQSYFDSGDICIVYVDGHEATVKKVVKSDDGLTLIGYNTIVYPPHFYPAKEVESLPVRVVGKVVEVRRQY